MSELGQQVLREHTAYVLCHVPIGHAYEIVLLNTTIVLSDQLSGHAAILSQHKKTSAVDVQPVQALNQRNILA